MDFISYRFWFKFNNVSYIIIEGMLLLKQKIRLEKVPRPFMEQFFSPFTKPEPETVHPDLYGKLIDEGTDLILEHFKKYSHERKRLVGLVKKELEIKEARYEEKLTGLRITASDAGNNGVDLRSAFVPMYASIAILVEGLKMVEEPVCRAGKPEVWSDEPNADRREALLTSKIQFEITIEALEKWKPKLVLLDGTLLLHYELIPRVGFSQGYKKDFNSTLESTIKLLTQCFINDIPVVGFVKRTRVNHLSKKFGAPNLRDTALLDLILKVGEYTSPNPMDSRMAQIYEKYAKKLKLSTKDVKEITSFYSSYIRTGFTTPFRLEIPKFCIDKVDEIASILVTTSQEDGIPFAIEEADRLTKMTTILSNTRTLMLYSKALDLVKKGELEPGDLNLLALQYGEPWVLREEIPEGV